MDHLGKTKLLRLAKKMHDESGASAVEFAIVAPVFLMLVLGIFAYGMYFGAAHGAQQLAADAARASVAGLTVAERSSISVNYVKANASQYPLIDPSRLSVQAGSADGNGDMFRVVVTYDATALPIWGFESLLPLPQSTITRTSVIRRGGFN